jgi:hypothetical protein
MMLRCVLAGIGILALSAFARADVTVSVNGALPIRTITETMFGGNLTAWDGAQSGGNTTFNALLKASGRTQMRWPGGSWGDAFLWSDMRGPNNANNWIVTYGQTLNLLNLIRAQALGSAYVGQIGYAMTEWDCSEGEGYARRRAYVNAMFHAQYLLELAKHKWELSNAWAQWEYGSNFSVYPVWYVHPLPIRFFGREMVTASSSNAPLVRAYAATDAAGDLTLFVANNSPTVDETVMVNVSGFSAGTTGL